MRQYVCRPRHWPQDPGDIRNLTVARDVGKKSKYGSETVAILMVHLGVMDKAVTTSILQQSHQPVLMGPLCHLCHSDTQRGI